MSPLFLSTKYLDLGCPLLPNFDEITDYDATSSSSSGVSESGGGPSKISSYEAKFGSEIVETV